MMDSIDSELDQLCDDIENSLIDSLSIDNINDINKKEINNNEDNKLNEKDTPLGFLLHCNNMNNNKKKNDEGNNNNNNNKLTKKPNISSLIRMDIDSDSLLSSSKSEFPVEEYARMCDVLGQRVSQALAMLDALEQQHHVVSEKTESLHGVCKKLLAEQNRLDKVVLDIATPLQFLQQLDELGPLLGLPLPSPLNPKPSAGHPNKKPYKTPQPDSEEFRNILEKLDKCSQFIETHTYFHDYADYSSKFRQLQIRALSLIRNSIVDAIQNASDSAIPALSNSIQNNKSETSKIGINNAGSVNALLYVRFRALGASLRSSIEDLEKRATIADFSDLLLECQRFYSYQRTRIVSIVIEQAPELTFITHSSQMPLHQQDMISKLRIVSNYFLQLCLSEYQLYSSFFSPHVVILKNLDNINLSIEANDGVNQNTIRDRRNSQSNIDTPLSPRAAFMQKAASHHRTDTYSALVTEICTPLYDIMRPLVVHQNNIDILCEGIRVLLGEIIEAQILPRGTSTLPLHMILLRIVKDLQERLIHCTSLYIRDELSGFSPFDSDLKYPERLLAANSGKDDSDTDRYLGWFPTLNRTLLLLSKIYRCVDDRVFQDLAQEALSSCTASLLEASKKISPPSIIDSQMFLIKHLLILREQIAPFETEMSVREVKLDFTPTVMAFNEFLSHRNALFRLNSNNAFFSFMQHGIPSIQEEEFNSKRDLENELKKVCEQFIVSTTKSAVDPLLNFLQKADVFSSTPLIGSSDIDENQKQQHRRRLCEQEFASKDRISVVIDQCEAAIVDELASTYSKMKLYLQNSQSESILFKPIQTNIFSTLSRMSRCLETEFDQTVSNSLIEKLGNIKTIISQMNHQQSQTQLSSSSSTISSLSLSNEIHQHQLEQNENENENKKQNETSNESTISKTSIEIPINTDITTSNNNNSSDNDDIGV